MKLETVEEIIAVLPKSKTVFYYFKDHYALLLLSEFAGQGMRLSSIKKSRWAKLLNKPIVKQIRAQQGNGIVKANDFLNLWPQYTQHFLLTLEQWGGNSPAHQQTCRKGCNLVLQLNFSNQHQTKFNHLLHPGAHHRLRSYGHPVMHPNGREFFRETLAWARIDLDFHKNEALIEEIQNDCLRNALRWRNWLALPFYHMSLQTNTQTSD